MLKRPMRTMLITVVALLSATTAPFAADWNDVIGALPKFAIPMREVGDRFQNMYFAAKDGNWALAYFMSKYMNGAMNPAKVTKPDEYGMWKSFYDDTFAPVNKAIFAKTSRHSRRNMRPQRRSAMSAMPVSRGLRLTSASTTGCHRRVKTFLSRKGQRGRLSRRSPVVKRPAAQTPTRS